VSEGLFRKAAIDKVSSPEQLDLLMRVTSPVGWLALLTVGLMIAAVGVWSVVGSIADLVDAHGTLFRGERLFDLKATMSGTVVNLTVRPGSMVVAGQVIATLKRERAASEQRDADAVTIEKNRAMSARLRGELGTMQRQWQLQKQLVDQGIKAPKDLLSIEQQMDGLRGQIDSLDAEVGQLQAQAQATTELKSTESGRVVEVIKSSGDKVREDEPLIRIEPQGQAVQNQFCGGNVHALVYIPASSAGKVKKGQFARVSPSDVKKEEYGFIFGKVEWVASYPASTADMTEKLKNDQLVREFMAGGPVFEARVCLEPNPANKVNPFKWSSSQGPPVGTTAGTTCTVSIVVDERKPSTYVVPAIRRTVGL
jgi:NHLM bacteriocin system secretion protein